MYTQNKRQLGRKPAILKVVKVDAKRDFLSYIYMKDHVGCKYKNNREINVE